jgi:hypothetical protein
MKMFTEATVKNMSQQSPGFAFANNLVNNPDNINTSFGPPPKAVETKSSPPTARASMQFTSQEPPQNRPDLSMGRGTMFRESGQDVGQGYADVNRSNAPMFSPPTRPEMRGPQSADIDSILSGLKTKTVNIHEQNIGETSHGLDDSMVSVSSLKDMTSGSVPKRSNRRKNRSDKNTVSLDI